MTKVCQLMGQWLIWISLATVTTVHAEDKNIVPNPGFEEEHEKRKGMPKAWTTEWTLFNTNTFWTQEDVHSGKYSIKMTQTNTTRSLSWTSPVIPVKGDTVYTFSFWAKCPETSRWGALMNFSFFDKGQQQSAPEREQRWYWHFYVLQEGSFNWHKFSRRYKAPKDACYASIDFQFYKSAGCVYFDDVSLMEEEQQGQNSEISSQKSE